MDPQSGLASKDDLWRLQNEMRNVYATQAEHADRLMRLEQRQDNDTLRKPPWSGNQSPYPGILNGTPQQGTQRFVMVAKKLLTSYTIEQGYNPAAEAFKNFDQESSTMLGSLHLDTDDEPRRGASRANSVRFDESAMHGHFGQGSRSSTETFPTRTGSAFGSHPMTERSSSHRSDGRQSSTHSARASSFGFEHRPLSATVPPFVPTGPPPGLFILGPVPSIIRCWLDTNFSNESLLYAVVCTGSFKSTLDIGLISRLGYQDQITTDREGQRIIKLAVYLPEATIQQSSARSISPAPTLPTLTTTFFVPDVQCSGDAIEILLGCDVLRTRNADIHFSLDRLTMFDDDRNKVSVPLVRPENATLFQNLQTTNTTGSSLASSIADVSGHLSEFATSNGKAKESNPKPSIQKSGEQLEEPKPRLSTGAVGPPATSSPSVIGQGRKTSVISNTSELTSSTKISTDLKDAESLTNGTSPDTPTRSESGGVWGLSGAWRRESTSGTRADSASNTTSSGYQRAGRGRRMKVLRPSRVNTSRTSSAQQPVGFDAAPSRFGDSGKLNDENQRPDTDRRSFSDAKAPLSSKPRTSNPIGGASAFSWMNSNQQKQSSTATD